MVRGRIREMTRYKILDALRGLSALYVVIHHLFYDDLYVFGINFYPIFRFGQEAVIIFFIISGIVVHLSYQRMSIEKSNFTYFFKARFYRIYIPLIIVLITSFIIFPEKFNFKEFFGTLFMLQDMDKSPGNIVSPAFANSPLWSLSYEWWFYWLYFFSEKLCSSIKKQNNIILIFTLTSAVLYLIIPTVILRFIMYFSIWWIGKTLADKYILGRIHSRAELLAGYLPAIVVATIMLINIVHIEGLSVISKIDHWGSHPKIEFRHHISGLVIGFFGLYFFENKSTILLCYICKFLAPFAPLAKFSYVLYISHWVLAVNASYLSGFLFNKNTALICYLIITFLYSYFVEVYLYSKIKRVLS